MRAIISVASEQGAREYQEDQAFIDMAEDGLLAAVFDGHGGSQVSNFLYRNVKNAFDAVANNPALPLIEMKMRGLFDWLTERTKDMEEGSTGSIVFIPSELDRAYVGVLGDSPVIIRTGQGQIITPPDISINLPTTFGDIWISPEHNVRANPAEVRRIQNQGGYVFGGYAFPGDEKFTSGGLQLTRLFGDADYASIVSREPQIFEVPLQAGSFVLVASDGLIDPAHGSKAAAADIVDMIGQGKTATGLVKYAIGVPTGDNASAILIKVAA